MRDIAHFLMNQVYMSDFLLRYALFGEEFCIFATCESSHSNWKYSISFFVIIGKLVNHLNNHPLPHRTQTQTTILQIYGVSISINKYSSMFIIVTQIRTFLFNLQGFMIVDRSPLYGSRGMLDQHRDMRLDIDNMTYEVIITFQCLLHFDLFVEIVGS